ncbi:MAG: hypothetical protein G3W71_19425 [Xanthomonas perforans]|uniref:Uncharacterized protein n=1 Tax=Xanthomonas perforans TaxID=442694 RepID=A0A6P0GDS8_XANPE|nr:hypothetical protein [Xanthomonas perforans]NEK78983.1 hypothetical protein [Xanthomonas perforans]NEL27208.1 hypothetical protein [Xanthomonas perforans]NEL40216.1 hypothetical protein [Xanthomonas perforans]NEL65285.1 hypothetical protein [Xanthomonas perforans]
MNPLQERRARVTVEVVRPNAQGVDAPQTYVFEQHRMSITVGQGGNQFGNAKVQVYGVPLESMNQIARLWLEVLTPGNTDVLKIDVWDGANYVPFFSGVITWSAVNASGMPNVYLDIEANAAMVAMNMPASPYAQEGPLVLWDALTAILEPTGLIVDYADTAPEIYVSKVRTTGTPLEQAGALMRGYPELTWYVNLQRFIVRPINGPLGGDPIVINKYSGMIGYPIYATSGITVSTIFDPRIRPGVTLDIQTAFDYVNRTKWIASVLQHNLQPNTPGGAWLTQIAANSFGSKGDESGSQY